MSSTSLVKVKYGLQREFSCPVEPAHLLGHFSAPTPCSDLADAVRSALDEPIGFPRLHQAVLPDDRVAVVLDLDTPEAPVLMAGIWAELSRSRLKPEQLTIVQPAVEENRNQYDPRVELPEEIRDTVTWRIHNAADDGACAYLASTAAGERLYLARDVTEADVVVTVGQMTFDRLLGYRGTTTSLYPGLSNAETVRRCRGQGHRELSPDDDRPLRELSDEAAWLLGTQFSLQVIASSGGGVSEVLAGEYSAVAREARSRLAERWTISIDERPDLIVASVDLDAGGHGWRQAAAALGTARNLVERGGKIVLLTDMRETPGTGIALLKAAMEPSDCYLPLREMSPPDLNEASELLDALQHAQVYLLSRMPPEEIESLHLTPLESLQEAERLIAQSQSCFFIESAQHTWGRIESDE